MFHIFFKPIICWILFFQTLHIIFWWYLVLSK